MDDETGQAPATKKSRRGRETAGDMVRSLGLVMIAVIALWYLAQPPDSDEQRIRVVDPSSSINSFAAASPETPVPGTLPDQWRPTSSAVSADPDLLRVGYVTPAEQYAEYAASAAPADEALPELTGDDAKQLAPVQIDGEQWARYRDDGGSLSLVRSYGQVTVVVGTKRASASLDELQTLVQSLTTTP